MAVKLRLMRIGKKKQPTYRVVAADARSPRDGRFIEALGYYNPRSEPSVIEIDNDKAVGWLRNGAKPTERVQKLLTISGAWSEFTGQSAPTPYVAPAPANAPAVQAAPAAAAEVVETAEAAEAEVVEAAEVTEAEVVETADAEDAAPNSDDASEEE